MATHLLDELLAGRLGSVTILPEGEVRGDQPPAGALLSGAFNPLHRGHEGMAAAATALTGLPVAFELPIVNADKGALERSEIARRAEQFACRHTLVLSRAPLFVQKAALYPGRVFVIGYDTAVRLVDGRYYGGEAGMLAALATLREARCSFLVAGRLIHGRFHTLADLPLPPAYTDLFVAIPASLFRDDISSSALRAEERGIAAPEI